MLLPITYLIQRLKASFVTTGLLRHGVTRLTRSPSSVPPLCAVNQRTAMGDVTLPRFAPLDYCGQQNLYR